MIIRKTQQTMVELWVDLWLNHGKKPWLDQLYQMRHGANNHDATTSLTCLYHGLCIIVEPWSNHNAIVSFKMAFAAKKTRKAACIPVYHATSRLSC